MLLADGVQLAEGLKGAAQVSHRIHAGLAIGIGTQDPGGEAALLVLDLLGQLTCRGQPQGPLEQFISFRLGGAVLDGQQALGRS